jgi:hypothetical protein
MEKWGKEPQKWMKTKLPRYVPHSHVSARVRRVPVLFLLVLSLREALWKYIELSSSTLPFLTLRFHKKDLTPTPNLLQIRPILPPLKHILSVSSRSFGWHGSGWWYCKPNVLGSHCRCHGEPHFTSLQRFAPLVVLVKKSARLSPVLMCISRVSLLQLIHELLGSKWNCTFSLRSIQV